MSSCRERRVLLLQGPPTTFFRLLRRRFAEAGVPTTQVVFNAADRRLADAGAVPFRLPLPAFAPFLEALMAREAITDVIYFADRVPYHRVAERVASRRGATPYALENGYLRPDWITLEPGGMGAYSRFPQAPAAIDAIADGAARLDETTRYAHAFATEAYYDVSYNLVALAGTLAYPHYERDGLEHPLREYVSWLPQLVRRQVARQRAPGQTQRLIEGGEPFFLFPMQLEADYQMRHNSPYRRLVDVVTEVFASFARAAPASATLLVKIHPLDNGLQNWQRALKRIKRDYGLTGRIRMLSAGPLVDMLAHARGVVTVNSTVGLTALRAGTPVKALGAAIYDLPGLTARCDLDAFWQDPTPPDPAFVDRFVRALARATQLRGSFYDPAGMEAAAQEIVRRVRVGYGEREWFVSPPPRLERAFEMGVPRDP